MNDQLKQLPPEIRLKVEEYIEFLMYKYAKEQTKKASLARKNLHGVYKGRIKMAEDFDEPLTDFEEY